jgi:hypothetical protein
MKVFNPRRRGYQCSMEDVLINGSDLPNTLQCIVRQGTTAFRDDLSFRIITVRPAFAVSPECFSLR